MLKEIDFHKALIRALSGKKGILITMPQPLEKLSIEEIRNLEKAGAKCLVDDEESEKPPYEPAIMIESMEDAPVEQSPPPMKMREPDVWIPAKRPTPRRSMPGK